MAHRKEVFQSKVLQKLYPAAQELVKEQSPSPTVEAQAKKKHVKRKAPGEGTASGEAVNRQSAADPDRRLYTAPPPPADYEMHSEDSVSLPQLKSINSMEEPAEENIRESDDEREAEEHRRRRRRRKKKATLHQDSGNDEATPRSESGRGQSGTPVDEGAERISRNKKRKLKKKRHKEKLLSTGLMPRAAALEFTYQKDGEEEDERRRAAEVSDFLRTTMETFLSDSSLRAAKAPHLSATVDDLLYSIDSGCRPDSVLRQLYSLRTFVQQIDTDKLEKALKELRSSSCMSAEETTAVVTLFQYWITDIVPVQGDKKTALSAAHP